MTDRRCVAGYSLFEVMVALAIMALTISIVVPDLSAGLRSASRHTAAMELDQQLLSLRRRVQTTGRPVAVRTIEESAFQGAPAVERAAELKLPAGWSYEVETPLTFFVDGTCDEGVIVLRKDDVPSATFKIEMPRCRPTLE